MSTATRRARSIQAGGTAWLLLAVGGMAAAAAPAPVKHKVINGYGVLPLSFEANRGQTASPVSFLARGRGYTLFLTSTEAVLALREGRSSRGTTPERREPDRTTLLRMKMVGANPAAAVAGLDALPGKTNYFIGNDRTPMTRAS